MAAMLQLCHQDAWLSKLLSFLSLLCAGLWCNVEHVLEFTAGAVRASKRVCSHLHACCVFAIDTAPPYLQLYMHAYSNMPHLQTCQGTQSFTQVQAVSCISSILANILMHTQQQTSWQ